MNKTKAIHWFRQDLRIRDNPSLYAAAEKGILLPVYILDDFNSGKLKMGAASRVWLHHSLKALNKSLDGHLLILMGDPLHLIPELLKITGIKRICWNRCYEPWRIQRDKQLKEILRYSGVEFQTFNGSLLWEPGVVLKQDGTPYRVFTPFYRKGCLGAESPRLPIVKPPKMALEQELYGSMKIDDLKLLPVKNWDLKIESQWNICEDAAHDLLDCFLISEMWNYREGRNYPAQKHVSRISPYLHHGQLSPNQVWHAALAKEGGRGNVENFLRELGWREFSYSLLYHFPDLMRSNLQRKFDAFPWSNESPFLSSWKRGLTGYPFVDAGMRELWQTGYMHNRVRMITASFLVKNLLIHWHHGRDWFWDCLVDADLANNSASWQWVAGCGADAAPYFRIFNPVTQGIKYDPEGKYTRNFIPELARLPNQYLFRPWEAPKTILTDAGILIGKTYPSPVVDMKKTRNDALKAYSSLKVA